MDTKVYPRNKQAIFPEYISCPVCQAKHVPNEGDLQNGVYSSNCLNCDHYFKFKVIKDIKDTITVTINGTPYTIGNEFDPATSIMEYMRQTGVSTGTKICCSEGGCGVCLVTATLYEPISGNKESFAVNGCLLQLYTCDGMEITTVEGIGSTKTTLNEVQKRIAKYNGVQCGYCTPGQVVNMYSLLKRNNKPTTKDIEDAYDTTICRCTGYRPILDAMKSFAIDAPKELEGGPIDIEDLNIKMCKTSGKPCTGQCSDRNKSDIESSVHIVGARAQWLKPTSLTQLTKMLKDHAADNYRLVFGNTGFGVFKVLGPWMFSVLIDLRSVIELYDIDTTPSDHILIGSNVSLTSLIELLNKSADPKLTYKDEVAAHLKRVASTGVRNLASWAGNLAMKNKFNAFPSDVFAVLETLGAKINLQDNTGSSSKYSVADFIKVDMKGKVIVSMELPKYSTNDIHVRMIKTSHRLQLSKTYITSGYNFRIESSGGKFTIKSKPSIIVQGVNDTFVHATQTETYLENKNLGDPAVLKQALAKLSNEIVPTPSKTDGSVTYRKSLVTAQFFKFATGICSSICSAAVKSAGPDLVRPIMSGTQDYGDLDPSTFPVTKPMQKATAQILATGEADFLDDLPVPQGQLFSAPVLSTTGNCRIDSIDPSKALAMPGVVKFVKASDIPGVNDYKQESLTKGNPKLPVFAEDYVPYAGQPIGLIIADSEITAQTAASPYLVQVKYKDQKPVITDLDEAIAHGGMLYPKMPFTLGDPEGEMPKAKHVLTGQIACGHQYHFFLENHTAICRPTESGGMDVLSASQWQDGIQETVSQVLGCHASKVNVSVKRLGGGFGGKIQFSGPPAAMCAVGAYAVNRPVKLHFDLHTSMKTQGKRTPYRFDYKVGFDDDGKMSALIVTAYSDSGCFFTPFDSYEWTEDFIDAAYHIPNILLVKQPVKTHKQICTAMRGPGSAPAMFAIEAIVDHIATFLQKESLAVQSINLCQKGQKTNTGMILDYCIMKEVTTQLARDAQFTQRKQAVDTFNKNNRWKKKGIHLMPNRFPLSWFSFCYSATVSVIHIDGTVEISHGGIDMGQGVNTKVLQVASYMLGVSMDKISIKPSSTISAPNSFISGGSVCSDAACMGVLRACEILNQRIEPVRKRMKSPAWKDLINAAYLEMIDLSATYRVSPNTKFKNKYNVYSGCCVEVELDVLTGQYQLTQVDILYDAGSSLNPELDVGQAEGGFVMGAGYFLQEKILFDDTTGIVITDGTWDYKPPLGKDLPIKFNIKLLKNASFPHGILRAKAAGEPPLVLGAAPVFALKRAIEAARADSSTAHQRIFALNAPVNTEVAQQMSLNDYNDYTYQ